MINRNAVIENLIKKGAKKVADTFTVTNVNVAQKENYTRLTLTLDKPFVAVVKQDDGTYKEQETNVLFTSTYSVGGLMRTMPQLSTAASHALDHVNAFKVLLAGAKINLLAEKVAEGTDYVSPFATDQTNKKHYDHATIINHIINIDNVDMDAVAEIKHYLLFA